MTVFVLDKKSKRILFLNCNIWLELSDVKRHVYIRKFKHEIPIALFSLIEADCDSSLTNQKHENKQKNKQTKTEVTP